MLRTGLPLLWALLGFSVLSMAFVVDSNEPLTTSELQTLVTNLQGMVYSHEEQLRGMEGSCVKCSIASKPTDIAFMATLSQHVTGCNNDAPVIFDNVLVNRGSGYDSRHGLFRAPVNGTYHFAVTISSGTSTSFHIVLVKNNNNNVVGYLYSENQHRTWEMRSTNFVVDLQAGDDVWFKCNGAANSALQGQGYHSHFSGFLISET